jgi:hypothetical protein
MTIVPTPIPNPDNGLYLFTDPSAGSKLNTPSHADLHTKLNTASENLHARLTTVEQNVNNLWPQVDQARLAAHMWDVPGVLDEANNNKLIMPIIWNMTGRTVLFSAAKVTVFTPPVGRAITVDIFTGHNLDGPILNTGLATSILKTPLTVPVGAYYSSSIGTNGFKDNAFHAVDNYVVAVVTQVGSTTPGADLTIQLNRLL